ncbi:hypothetical protein HYQ46_006257 [Verticillium longisporum]|nr:hypothetical protein HYQ44_016124 [Verticillium longisporum]KAG7145003.1 hypothetical protein HYQ46_006257 [Verticillium longisporum]
MYRNRDKHPGAMAAGSGRGSSYAEGWVPRSQGGALVTISTIRNDFMVRQWQNFLILQGPHGTAAVRIRCNQRAPEDQHKNIVGDLDLNGHRSNVHTVQRGLSVLTLQRYMRAPTKSCHGRNFGQAQTDDVPLPVKSVNMSAERCVMRVRIPNQRYIFVGGKSVVALLSPNSQADAPDKAMAPVGAADYVTLWTERHGPAYVLPGNIG